MAAVDRSAPEPVEVLVERAGWAVAAEARAMMGGTYGRRVVVVAGRGNNGADGRVAARLLAARGARVEVVEPSPPRPLPSADLVVDAAYGTGLSRSYEPPDPGSTPVLAVDIPSGLSGLTGLGRCMTAVRTVTFAAWKPGLLLGEGPAACGEVALHEIGLQDLAARDTSCWLVEDDDVAALAGRSRHAHKWQTAVLVVGGSETMNGAPLMAARAAMRAGAGYTLVAVPGSPPGGGLPPGEHVGVDLPGDDWVPGAARAAERVRALVVGPGLGARARQGGHGRAGPVGRLLGAADVPAVVDADGISALGGPGEVAAVASGRQAPIVLTPHEGEYRRLTGHDPDADRIADVRRTAQECGAVVLLKGSTTVVADPQGRVRIVNSGSARLATAGTGDILSGMIAAFMARGETPLDAAALAAHVHGRAAASGRAEGLVAGDLPDLVSAWLSGRTAPVRAG
jgi:NAD(P)H-hydrate epimerase